jgi:hypothetical protein
VKSVTRKPKTHERTDNWEEINLQREISEDNMDEDQEIGLYDIHDKNYLKRQEEKEMSPSSLLKDYPITKIRRSYIQYFK